MARKILLADDSVTAQNMGRRILSDAGYDVTTVNNGSAALKKIAESKPDLIVLDVYMPGYGGLEVCQRVRESQETARIPVLLTVGKLEPFKADEARRVRADAFIVKPFEASELLTALTKLEDKIVPQPQPHKPGRFAKAMASAEQNAGGNEFGDLETGWKNRLKIPPPHHTKSQAMSPATSEPHEAAVEDAPVSAAGSPTVQNQTQAPVEAAQTAEIEIQKQLEQSSSGSGASSDLSNSVAENQSQTASGDPSAEVKVETQKDSEVASEAVSKNSTASAAEEEVAAALASLAPTSADGNQEQPPVTMAVAAVTEQFTGPRWIAEAAPLSTEESSLVLEEEMQKARAAMKMAETAQSVEPSPIAGSAESTANSVAAAEGASFAGEAAAKADQTVSENTDVQPAVATSQAPTQETEVPASNSEAPVVEPQAAYAAAAAAGGEMITAAATEAVATPATTPESTPQTGVGEKHEAELAAAWASWKQEREPGPGPASPVADTPAAFEETHRVEPIRTEAESAAPESSDDAGIASIVDSVLAELKPKLMQEIAKKMGKDKK